MNDDLRTSVERLYRLLPAAHRVLDADRGGALRALVGVLAAQAQAIEADVDRLYDDWFIETCQEWLVPYVGALLGVRGLHPIRDARVRSQRAYVANTLAYRRRKGTATMLEQLTLDVTGWPARAVEFFERIATTQNLNHRRPHVHLPDLRDAAALELVDGPFDLAVHTAGVRHLPEGRYDIPTVGLFVWRLQAYPLARATARAVTTQPGLFTFDPLGRSRVLWNRRRDEPEIGHLAEEADVPGALRRRALFDELERRRQASADGASPVRAFLDDENDPPGPVLRVHADGQEIGVDQLVICNLEALPNTAPEDWQRPPAKLDYPIARSVPPQSKTFPIRVAVDPELGRLAFPADAVPAEVEVSFCYAFPGDVGGGPYDRRATPSPQDGSDSFPPPDLLDHPDGFAPPRRVPSQFPDLAAALAGTQAQQKVLVEIEDSHTHVLPAAIALNDGDLVIQARPGVRPVLRGDTAITGKARSRLLLSGLLVDGAVSVQGKLAKLEMLHTTIVPSHALTVTTGGTGLEVRLVRSICGAISLPAAARKLSVEECIVDAAGGSAIDAPATEATIDRATVLGSVSVRRLDASDAILRGLVAVERCQEGCVRYSWLPSTSRTPRRFRCQPDLGMAGLGGAALAAALARLFPAFTSVSYDNPAYAQLAASSPEEIRAGAEDGSEMGVWSFLQQPQREANFRRALDEYLRFGLEAGLIHAT